MAYGHLSHEKRSGKTTMGWLPGVRRFLHDAASIVASMNMDPSRRSG